MCDNLLHVECENNLCEVLPSRVAEYDNMDFSDGEAAPMFCSLDSTISDGNSELRIECKKWLYSQRGKQKEDINIQKELLSGALSLVEDKPHYVHALIAVPKPVSGLWSITDCSRPVRIFINGHMTPWDLKFRYKSIDTVVELMKPYDYMTPDYMTPE